MHMFSVTKSVQVGIFSGGTATVLALTSFPKSPLQANGQPENPGDADEQKEGLQVVGGVTAEVPLLPYRIHLVSVRNDSYSASPAAHGGYQGPLLCCGIVRFGCDQAFGSVEPSAYIHLFTGGKKGEQGSESLGGRTRRGENEWRGWILGECFGGVLLLWSVPPACQWVAASYRALYRELQDLMHEVYVNFPPLY